MSRHRLPCSIRPTPCSTTRTTLGGRTGPAGSRTAACTSRVAGTRATCRCSRCTILASRRCAVGCSWRTWGRGPTCTRDSRSSASSRRVSRGRTGCLRTCSPFEGKRVRSAFRLPHALAVVALLAGCSGDRRTPLVVYSPHGRDLLTLFAHRFEQLHPDVVVHWLDMGSQEVYDRLRSERANPQADVWFGGPGTIFARAARDSLLQRFHPTWTDAIAPHGRGPGDAYFAAYLTPAVIVYAAEA